MNPSEPFLPEHMRDGMKLYLENGIEPGSFLSVVLNNNLKEAVGRADHINLQYLTNIVSYCYNCVPSAAWGRPNSVESWIERFKTTKEVTHEI